MDLEELIPLLVAAALNGTMLAVGMLVGSRLTSKSIVRELDKWMNRSEFFQTIKKTATDQQLIEKATKFFDEATIWITSPEAKNLFKNITAALKEFTGEPEVKIKMPKRGGD